MSFEEKYNELKEKYESLVEEYEKVKGDLRLYNSLFDQIPDTVYFKDEECRFIKINKAQANEKTIIRTGKIIINKEEKIQKGNHKWFWVTATKVPIKNEQGKIVGIGGISRDISKYINK